MYLQKSDQRNIRQLLQPLQVIECCKRDTPCFDAFESDIVRQYAVAYAIASVGGSVLVYISGQGKRTLSEIDFAMWSDLSDSIRCAHGSPDAAVLWKVMTTDAPALQEYLENVLKKCKAEEALIRCEGR